MDNSKIGEVALDVAFDDLMSICTALEQAGLHVRSAKSAPVFSYLLSPKQYAQVRQLASEEGWPVPNCRGILIDLNAINHPRESRAKESVSAQQTAEILKVVYGKFSRLGVNKKYDKQALIFNSGKALNWNGTNYYAVAVLVVDEKDGRVFLRPVTAYHSTDAKIKKIRMPKTAKNPP